MKKFLIITVMFAAILNINSCSESDLNLLPQTQDVISSTIDNENDLQAFLNGAYLSISNVDVYGGMALVNGDLISDIAFQTNLSNSPFTFSANLNYTAFNNDFTSYRGLYNTIVRCNTVINNEQFPNSNNVREMQGQAKILRAFAYMALLDQYSPSPSSGVNQEYGVPLHLENYNATLQLPRATVAEVYAQIILDLQGGLSDAPDIGAGGLTIKKVILTKTAAKLLLSRVYLTRRAPGDAALALQYASEIVNDGNPPPNNPPPDFAPIVIDDLPPPPGFAGATAEEKYRYYFSSNNNNETTPTVPPVAPRQPAAEGHQETIWELDMNASNLQPTNIGSNGSLPDWYLRTGTRKSLMFNKSFYDSFANTDVRKGAGTTGLLTSAGQGNVDSPPGYWTNKYPKLTLDGNYFRNIKILRFAEAQLNRIEALYLTGDENTALIELNTFAASRRGSTYTGTDLLNDILTERAKEFYGEGQRFRDLKRYGLPLNKPSNCTTCNLPANDLRFVFPIDQEALTANQNLTQYPGY
ncbi:MAG: RagB/SusD family nutrient uptake outer membrane protein [Flavobacteriaceae bacterium]|jgi:hypothetical protein|nr:RagB/SusD family nutrient uptake outer membrane protein [Flavobacteriaceae bacterium]